MYVSSTHRIRMYEKARRRHFAGLGETSLEVLPAPLETKESEKV
jgi:hypothetical protein